ncbi:hypothetical protein QUB63_32140 [Microcoleus sp. ARI1-B5]|uniref:hypothetical protein n=1 Tax=unclassified Microcoleus TaxID=2642155 RepID=UPI002FD02493
MPLTWKATFLFVTVATLILLPINWLILSDTLPIEKTINYSTSETNFIQMWIKLAAFIGLLLPGFAFVIWWRYPEAKKILGLYLIVLIVQIAAEQILSRVLFPSLVVFSGTMYTAFRIWQLWQGQQLLTAAQLNNYNPIVFSSLLWLLLLFWLSNLIVLFAVAWPRIL